MKGNFFYISSVITLILTGIIFVYGAYLSMYPFKWITYYNSPFPVMNENKTVMVGDALIYQTVWCRFNDKQATFSKDILSTDLSQGTSLPTFSSSFGANCRGGETPSTSIISSTIIPQHLPEGEYIMKMTYQMKINPLRTLTASVQTEPFFITHDKN